MRTKKRNARVARRLYRLCLVDGLLDESRVRLVARRIAAGRRQGAVGILMHFRRLVALDRDRHTMRVESAVPLSSGLRERLAREVSPRFGRGIEARFDENADLIAGLRIQVGSRVYDGSVRGRLAAIDALQ